MARQPCVEWLVTSLWRGKVQECGAPQALELDPRAGVHGVQVLGLQHRVLHGRVGPRRCCA